MREDLKQKTVLAMYDVRGIQNYIFSTNKVRDIIGASALVEDIIMTGLKEVCEQQNWSKDQFLLDWEKDNEKAFLEDENIKMQVLFVGGGNAYVLFRKGETCEKVNRALAKYLLEKTYSLNLAVAVVEKTDSYAEDYKNINAKMREIKAVMQQVKPMGAFPFMPVDSSTGYPLAAFDHQKMEYVSTETKLKRKYYAKSEDKDDTKILDDMITGKGQNSFLAVVHIDGNSVGNRIKQIMEPITDYAVAVNTMRTISKNLKYEFKDCYDKMCEKIDANLIKTNRKDKVGKLYRKIIVAGDDITFICNAQIALFAVKEFLKEVATKLMYFDEASDKAANKEKYALSACAGIAYCHSHFPFSDAYEVAESCCSSAKRVAKQAENRAGGKADGMIGNYVDFQICKHIKAADLSTYREKQYGLADGSLMISRPYYVNCEGYDGYLDLNKLKGNKEKDLERIFFYNLRVFQREGLGQSKYKKLRNAFAQGKNEVDKEIVFLQSRGVELPITDSKTWYDALEMVSLCEVGGEKS